MRALDATNGALLWEYKRDTTLASRTKTLAIYRDLVYYAAPDGFIVAIDARTGKMRWETKTDGGMTSGPVVVEGKVITGRTCAAKRTNCYIVRARRADRTGSLEVLHRRRRRRPGRRDLGRRPRSRPARVDVGPAGRLRPGDEAPLLGRRQPDAEHAHGEARGNVDAIRTSAPADLYSNSTLALNPTQASWSGTSSICRATTGTRTTRTSGRCCAPRSGPIRSS